MPLVLVQNPVIVNAGYDWKDIEGVQYHFPNQYKNRFVLGTPFVYYRGTRRRDGQRGSPEYFGHGIIGSTRRDDNIPESQPKKDWAWYCSIDDYVPFAKPVPAKIDGNFIEHIARNHWSVGVRPLPQQAFERIMSLAGETGSTCEASITLPDLTAITIDEADGPLLVPRTPELVSAGSEVPAQRYTRNAAPIGRRAEEVVHRYLLDHAEALSAKNIRWMAQEGLTPGWDLQYENSAGDVVGVEVKGATGPLFASVDVTAGEWKAASSLGDRYWLYLVANCCSNHPVIQRLQNPAHIFQSGRALLVPVAYRLTALSRPLDYHEG